MVSRRAPGGQAIVAAGAVTAAFAIWLHQGWGGDLGLLWMENVALTLVPLAAAVACWSAASRSQGAVRTAWSLLAAATACWGLGSLVVLYVFNIQQSGVPVLERTIAVPGLADAFFLAFFPLSILGLLRLPAGGIAPTTRLRFALDGLLIVTCMLFLAIAAGVDSNVQLGGADALRPDLCAALGPTLCPPVGWMFAIANPLGDVLVASVAVIVAMFAPRVDRRALALLVLGFLSIAVADVDFSTRWLRGDTSLGNLLDAGWVLGFGLIAAAALQAARPAGEEEPDPGTLAILPYIPFTLSAAAAAAVQVRDGSLRPLLFWIAFVAIGLVLARQFVAMVENHRLRRRAEDALARLRESEAFRSRFMHTVTHDLRNPLTPILLQLSVLDRRQASPEVKRGLGIIGRNVQQVERLVADLADVGKLQDGQLALVKVPMDLADTLRDAHATFAPGAAERRITVALDCMPLPGLADEIRLRQVVMNLVSNALKFTPEGGTVSVRGRRQGDRILVEVQDSGRGLTPEEQARLFQPFSQVHDPSGVKERGTGLGLYITKGIVERHGGQVGVSSQGLGKGSTFWFTLPCAEGGTSVDSAALQIGSNAKV